MQQGFSITENQSLSFQERLTALLAQTPAQLLLLSLAVVSVYLHTLNVPFYFDDYTSIRDNAAIRDFGSVWEFSQARMVGYLSFALNYSTAGYALPVYHLTNILVHLLAVIAVYFLVRAILATSPVFPYTPPQARTWLPLLVALLFALHPLQTQAVTYITQRLASLAALFYLLTMAAYLRGRLVETRKQQVLSFSLAGLFATLAFFTKQNTVTLPLALLLLEVYLVRPGRKYLLRLTGAGAAGLLLVVVVFHFALDQSFLEFLAASTAETDTVTRAEYFSVQMQVLWSYLLKFFLPFNLHLDYDIAVPASFWNLKTLAFALGHLTLVTSAVLLIRRSPVIAFGILFYYTAHLVESSLIPIRDFGFEHRTYLPNFGLCLAVGWALLVILPRRLPREAVAAASIALVIGLGVLTWLRNDLWRDPIAFFQHEIAVNPGNFRAHSMLGENYLRVGEAEEALRVYQEAARLYGTLADKETNAELAFFSNYVLALDETGNYDQAIQVIENNVNLETLPGPERALFLSRRGIVYAKTNRFDLAEADFQQALQFNPQNLDALNNYSKVLLLTGRVEASRDLFERVRRIDPSSVDAQLADYFRANPAPPVQ